MQKRHKGIKLYQSFIELDGEFPISNFRHVQKDQNYGIMHYHNQIEIGICYQGTGIFFVDNEIIPFSKGDVSIIYPFQSHMAYSDSRHPSYWNFLNVDSDVLFGKNAFFKDDKHYPNIISSQHSNISNITELLFNELENADSRYRESAKSLIYSLFIMVSRLENEEKSLSYFGKSNDYLLISDAINYINNNYNSGINLKQLSEMCHLSDTYFRRIFKRLTGKTPFEYIYNIRIEKSKILLKSGEMQIGEIALEVGYPSISSFNRHFKELCGISPSSFRKNSKTV